jgi:hypothetical protein
MDTSCKRGTAFTAARASWFVVFLVDSVRLRGRVADLRECETAQRERATKRMWPALHGGDRLHRSIEGHEVTHMTAVPSASWFQRSVFLHRSPCDRRSFP